MTYLMRSGCACGRSIKFAATSHDLTTLRWLRDSGAMLDTGSFSTSCLTANIQVMHWFDRNECSWDGRAMDFAIVQYGLKNKSPAGSWAVHAAVSTHRLQMVRFL